MDFNSKVKAFRKVLSETYPYHFTTLENLYRILEMGKLLSKNSLIQNGIDFYDVGDLEDDEYQIDRTVGRKFKIFDVNAFIDESAGRIEFKYRSKVLSLRDYVRLYLFTVRIKDSPLLVPRFLFLKIRNLSSIAILFFVNAIELTNYLENIGAEYYIIYGHPHRKNPSAFKSIDGFVKYLASDLPGVDTLREWLKVDTAYENILSMDLELRSEFFNRYTVESLSGTSLKPCLSQLLASELIVREELDLKETLRSIMIFGKDPLLKLRVKRVKELCNRNNINSEIKYYDIDSLRYEIGVRY